MTAPFVRSQPNSRQGWLWFPRQHGAWALLVVPLLIGIGASRAEPVQALLAAAAIAGYLTAATTQSWARARFSAWYLPSLALYAAIAVALTVALVAGHPALLILAVIVVPAAVLTFEAGRARRPRHLLESLAEAAQALVLAPSAAWLGGISDGGQLFRITAFAGLFLVSSVLSVRSAIRERGNTSFAAASAIYHLASVPVAALVLGPAYGVVAGLLAARAIAVPIAQRRLAGTTRQLRPIQLGMIEGSAAVVVVLVAFMFPPR